MRRSLFQTTPCLAAMMLANTPAYAQSDNLSRAAIEIVRGAGAGECLLLEPDRQAQGFQPEIFKFQHKEVYDDAPQTYRLIRVPCWLGAYNQGDMYVLVDPYDTMTLMSFAVPTYKVTYLDPQELTKVKSIRVTGYTSRTTVVLSGFDPHKLEISEHNRSRGVGDAGTSAVWRFETGSFTLQTFYVDATYDGEINPKRLVDFGGPR